MSYPPIHCPICDAAMKNRSSTTVEMPVSSLLVQDSYICSDAPHYACSNLNPKLSFLGADFSELFVIGTHEEMFHTGCIAIRVFYIKGKILTHQIDLHFIHKRPFKLGVRLNDDIFRRVFSRDNLHPLLEKIEKYEVFS